jgi:hypothetical protein
MTPFLKYGLWTGIISSLWGLSCFTIVGWLNSTLFHHSIPATQIRSYSGLFNILILVIGIYLGMQQAKLKGGNTLTYGQAVKTGIIIACITAVIVACFSYLYCTIINPGYADFMVKDTENALKAAGKPPREISLQLDAVRKEFSTGAQVGMALVGQAVVGTVAAFILGLFIRTKKAI